ncbi:MAG: hypothetical protein LRY50_00250 [Geovibrio sp.]|nr:hypothetical protein [Geovibrio sp.]
MVSLFTLSLSFTPGILDTRVINADTGQTAEHHFLKKISSAIIIRGKTRSVIPGSKTCVTLSTAKINPKKARWGK